MKMNLKKLITFCLCMIASLLIIGQIPAHAKTIFELGLYSLDVPAIGEKPDYNLAVDYEDTFFQFHVDKSITYYKFNSSGIGTVMPSTETFQSGVKYGVKINLNITNDEYVFSSKTIYDEDYDEEYEVFAGVLKINGTRVYDAYISNNGRSMRINYLWGQTPSPAPHKHVLKKDIIEKATFMHDGYYYAYCDCGYKDEEDDTIPGIFDWALQDDVVAYDGKVHNTEVILWFDGYSEVTTEDIYTVKVPSGRKEIGEYTYTVTLKGPEYYGSKNMTLKIVPEQVPNIKTSNTSAGIKVSWDKVGGGVGYYLYRSDNDGKSFTRIKTLATNSYTDTASKTNGKKYIYKVVAYKSVNGKTYKGKTSSPKIQYYQSTPAISSLTSPSKGRLTVKWTKNTTASAYQVQYSLSSSFASGNKAVTISGNTTLSKVITGLVSKKKYYVRVRSYKTVGSVKYTSAWSPVKYVIAK